MATLTRFHPATDRYYVAYYGPYWGQTARTDAEISDDVKFNLAWDSYVDATKVDVAVDAGVVTLTGTVDNFLEKRSAGDDAMDTLGVIDVINNLRISR
jgi:osmotically-inducible protein OsmY